jgi:hypothetical protein
MFMDRLSYSLDVCCYTEARNSSAFDNFKLRSLSVVRQLCSDSPQKITAFKPLMDAHRARELLDAAPTAKIIWMFRRAEDRASSAVAKFGPNNLKMLAKWAHGEGLDVWQAQGLSAQSMKIIRGFDYESMAPETAAALYWYVRNRLFAEQGLADDPRAIALSYESVVADAPTVFRKVCTFVGCGYRALMSRGVHGRSVGKSSASTLPVPVADLCSSLYKELAESERRCLSAL